MSELTPSAEVTERQPPRISIVIVSFNRADRLRENLTALGAASPAGDRQIMVVDNGSSDGASQLDDEFPGARFSRLPKNFGQIKALNIGLRAAEGEYILCLHDDVVIDVDAVVRLADYLEAHPDTGAVAPLLTDASGTPAAQARPLPSPSHPDPEFRAPEGDDEEIEVECVSGAAIMFRSYMLRAMRQIDGRYGNYGSAIEICGQMRRAGKKVAILHSVTAIHESSPSPMDAGALAADRAAGTAVFIGKHYGFVSGLLYRIKAGVGALFTLRFSTLLGAVSGQKIDGG